MLVTVCTGSGADCMWLQGAELTNYQAYCARSVLRDAVAS